MHVCVLYCHIQQEDIATITDIAIICMTYVRPVHGCKYVSANNRHLQLIGS